jgi:hypothetical protein
MRGEGDFFSYVNRSWTWCGLAAAIGGRAGDREMYSMISTETLSTAFELLCYVFSAGAAAITFLMTQK